MSSVPDSVCPDSSVAAMIMTPPSMGEKDFVKNEGDIRLSTS